MEHGYMIHVRSIIQKYKHGSLLTTNIYAVTKRLAWHCRFTLFGIIDCKALFIKEKNCDCLFRWTHTILNLIAPSLLNTFIIQCASTSIQCASKSAILNLTAFKTTYSSNLLTRWIEHEHCFFSLTDNLIWPWHYFKKNV
jgi:hypothetical protein